MDFVDVYGEASTGDFVDAYEYPKEETTNKGNNTFFNSVQDVARFFAPMATTGFNAIGTGIASSAAGEGFTKGFTEGAKSSEFLGMDLSMETTAGKFVEKHMGEALEKLRSFGGEKAPELLRNESSRDVLKAIPAVGNLVRLYEALPEEGKTKVEAVFSAGGASAPELMLVLLGGKGAKKISKEKVQVGDEGLLDIVNELEQPAKEVETPKQQFGGELKVDVNPDEAAKVHMMSKDLSLEPFPKKEIEAPVVKDNLIEYEKVTPEQLRETQGSLPLEDGMPEVQYQDFATPEQGVDFIQTVQTDMTPAFKGEPGQLDLPGINKPLGQRGFGKNQSGAINLGAFLPEKSPQSLTEKAKSLSKDEWVGEFKKTYPEKAHLAEQVYDKLSEKQIATIGTSKSSEGGLGNVLDVGLGSISTRIGNISQPLLHRAVKYEQGVLENTHKRLTAVDDFSVSAHALPKASRDILDNAILNNDAAKLDNIFTKLGGKFKSDYYKARKALDEVGAELQSVGRLSGLRKDYFPRVVKDVDGLLGALGTEKAELLKSQLMKAQTPLEEINIVNSFLRRNYKTQYKPGFSKERKLDDVPPELQQFYATPTEAYHTYMRNATQEVETAKFFGRNAVKDATNGRVDINQSIGNLVLNELKEGKITYKDADKLQEMLQARFGGGNMSSNKWIQDAKNIGYSGLLGDTISAATQLADPAISVYANGLRPTLQSLVVQLTPGLKDKVNIKDFGLLDHISEEFVNDRTSAKFLNNIFKISGFSSVDSMGKNVVINSALRKASNQVNSKQGLAKFTETWEPRFGEEFPQLVSDLQAGKITEPVKTLLFSELSKVQPITKLEMPQKYLEMPNGRILYMLKTFMIKQADVLRNESYNKIKRGNIKEGVGNLIKYSMVMGIAGTATDELKNWLLGRDSDELSASDIPLNMLKSFGLSEYVINKAKTGKVGEAAGGVILPPYTMYDVVMEDVIKALDGDEDTSPTYKSVQRVPLIGKFVYNWLLGGAEEFNDKQYNKEE